MSGCVFFFLRYKLDLFTQLSFRKYHHDPQNLLLITLVFFPTQEFFSPQTRYFLLLMNVFRNVHVCGVSAERGNV